MVSAAGLKEVLQEACIGARHCIMSVLQRQQAKLMHGRPVAHAEERETSQLLPCLLHAPQPSDSGCTGSPGAQVGHELPRPAPCFSSCEPGYRVPCMRQSG